jgi:hypothetical protein
LWRYSIAQNTWIRYSTISDEYLLDYGLSNISLLCINETQLIVPELQLLINIATSTVSTWAQGYPLADYTGYATLWFPQSSRFIFLGGL